MPSKPKLHKSTDKSKLNIKKPESADENTHEADSNSGFEQQFELELCWCIQQLQIALREGKLNSKQVQDHTKALNTLMSNAAPMVKKRQVMRLSFGDYRAKMAAEEQKLAKSQAKLKVTPANPNNKSVFVKKLLFGSTSSSSFTFGFKEPEVGNISEDIAKIHIDPKRDNDFHFACSDNSFRFNFTETDNQ